jgi:hypothetical protein
LRRLPQLLGLLAAIAIAVLALRPRLLEMRRELWLDEATQSFVTMAPRDFAGMRERTSLHAAPLLDFALRRFFWYRLLGHDERGLRLPSLFYSLCAIAVAGLAAHRRLRESLSSRWLALLGGIVAAMWCSVQSSEVHYAVEARLYSFISLGSMAWAAAYVLFRERPRGAWLLAAASLFYLQTHFFAIPLVGAAYAAETTAALWRRRWSEAALRAATFAALLGVTLAVSWPGFAMFASFSQWTASPPQGTLRDHAAAGLGLFWGYFRYLELPLGVGAAWVGVALAGLALPSLRLRAAARRLALLVALALPLVFVLARARSSYEFFARYYMPFAGLGLVALVLALETIFVAARQLSRRVRLWPGMAGVLVAGVALAPLVARAARLPGRLSLPARNFSGVHQLFESLKRSGEAVFTVANPCWADVIPILYWRFIGASPTLPIWVPQLFQDPACTSSALGPGGTIGRELDGFFREQPDGTVMLFQIHTSCPPAPASPRASGERIERLAFTADDEPSCFWIVRHARSRERVEEIARQEGFPVYVRKIHGAAGAVVR